MIDGIYILANDVVYDQLVALLNSTEANAGREIPVCIIPYNEQLDKVKAEIASRNNITLFENYDSIAYWDDFATQIWKNYPRAQKTWRGWGFPELYRLPMHRKLCGLDGPFDRFIYFDADTLLMGPVDYVYEKLDAYDWVVNDFQYKSDLKFVFDGSSEQMQQVFNSDNLQSKVFCAGWFATKKNIFSPAIRAELLDKLIAGEAEVMCCLGPDQSLFNYMVLRSKIPYYNFAFHDCKHSTGNHWSSQFDVVDNMLYDQGRRLTYLHYMSINSSNFTQLCAGEDVNIPYRDVFLHYRYLKSPEQRPTSFKRQSPLIRLQKTTTSFFNQKVNNIKLNYRNFKDRITK
ncbi:Lipopolysaccharide biosynthesis protein, LPS:glycosyltransferase [Nostoc flagelliforme CCNUN1]|uniref:Lipopolysaccharide biosynthesis protein, LPS:glycosyltransferase n=1 Tax=Nostoc flagelliforme CCNUN1 TaxID=2038116 RepID=A0A2K8SY33_9NOSO|nr:Npun_R2821/Npun_R2822 family protein [Nostoc flagelliforme]AUB40359.1 Lipopolysaccharide biosynthesis protein, LPS:glycosyltransferase [Nostoc flagelliforme CCNUN1]